MKYENLIKHIFTTILGAVIMSLSVWEWANDGVSDMTALIVFFIGFALLWMRDEIPAFVKKFAQAAINEFSGK